MKISALWNWAFRQHRNHREVVARLNSALAFSAPSWEAFGKYAAECELKAADPKLLPSERQSLRDQAARFREAQLEALGNQ